MKNDLPVFIFGIIVGALGFLGILVICGHAPRDISKKYTTEAVQLGYGRWVVDSNNFGNGWAPGTHFEWVTNRVEK